MINQEIKNLDQLDDFQILVESERSSSIIKRKLTRKKSYGAQSIVSDIVEVDYSKDQFGSLNLSRKVIVKSYAPKTFDRIRLMMGVQDYHILESLDPSSNIRQI